MFDLLVLAGLSGLQETFINDWLGPVFLGLIAVYGAIAAWKRKIRELAASIVIFIIVALMIFLGGSFFGKDGSLTKQGKNLADKVGN